MNKLLRRIGMALVGMAMAVGVGVAVANNSKEATMVKADTESLAITGDINATLKVAASSTGDDIKSGKKMNKGSSGTITIPKSIGSTKVYYHAVAWKDEGQTIGLSCTNATLSSSSQAVTPNANVSGSGTTYVIGDFSTYLCSVDVTQTSAVSDMVITLTAASGKRFVLFDAYCETSSDPSIKIDSTDTELTVDVKENADLEKTLTLSNVTMAELSYDFDDDKILVEADNANKKITISGVEHTTTATDLLIKKGNTTLYTVHVNVLYDNDVTISPETSTLKQGATLQLSAVSSRGADTFTWSSSDKSVATVSETGLVTGVAEGSVTITATSNSYAGTSGTKDLTITFSADNSVASFYDVNELSNNSGSSASGNYVKGVFSGGSTVISSVTTYKTSYNKFGGLSMGTGSYEGYVIITMNSAYKLKSVSVWAASVDNAVTEPTVLYGTGNTADTDATKLSNNAKIFAKSEPFDDTAVPFTYTFASDAQIVKFHATSKNAKWTIYKVVLCWTVVEASSLSFDVGSSFSLMNTITKTLKVNASPLYYNVALGALTWNSTDTDVATVTSAGVVEAKADSGTSTITATASGKTATTVVHAISKVASSVTIDASIVSTGATSDINGVTWAFSGASRYGNDYKSGNTLIAYTRGSIQLDSGYIQNSTAAFFKIKKVIVALCLSADQSSGYDAALTVVGSNTSAGAADVSSTNSTSGILKTFTLEEECDYVKISSSTKVDFNSVTIEYATPEETIVSVAEFILGLQPDRGEEVIGSCTIDNGTYLAAKGRMAMLSASARSSFQTSEDITVSLARTRYGYWAANNHDANPYDGELTPQNLVAVQLGLTENEASTVSMVAIISAMCLTAIGGFCFIRRRREN